MVKVFVFYYLVYGYIEIMVYVVVEGVKFVGVEVIVKCVLELVLDEVVKVFYYKMDQVVLIVIVDELVEYDVIIVGVGMCYGIVVLQMCNFWDQMGGLWFNGKFVGKVGLMFILIVMQYGGQEIIIMGFILIFLYYGMVVVGFFYVFQGQMGIEEVKGGLFYGVFMIINGDGLCQFLEIELEGVCFQGVYVVKIVVKQFV